MESVLALLACLTDDLRRRPWKGSPDPLAGHCYVAAEALYHRLGGRASGYVPQNLVHEGAQHWYLRHSKTGEIVDPTASQFRTRVPYEQGRGRGFLTATPSRRARTVLARLSGDGNLWRREFKCASVPESSRT